MDEIVGQQKALEYLKRELESDQVSHAYLFYGPKNVGKTESAKQFSLSMICDEGVFGGCGECANCRLANSGNHPDYIIYDGYEGMGVQEVREIIKNLELKAHRSKNRVFIISNSERLSTSAFNSFLKSLEEPNPGNIIILTASNLDNVIDTIKSRTRMVKFELANKKDIFEHLNKNLLVKRDLSEKITMYSGGRPGLATLFSRNSELFEKYLLTTTKMWQAYKNPSVYDKISFTDSFVKDENIVEILEFSQIFAESNLFLYLSENKEGDCTQTGNFISSLEKALSLLNKNIGKKIVIDNLMLGNLNG